MIITLLQLSVGLSHVLSRCMRGMGSFYDFVAYFVSFLLTNIRFTLPFDYDYIGSPSF